MSRPLPLLLITAALAAILPSAADAQRPSYPVAARDSVVERYGAHQVPEPFRWMEDLNSPQVKAWVDAENAVTFAYLGALPLRDTLRARLTALWNYPRVGAPVREAHQLFFRENSGLQRQSVLFREATLEGPPRELLDPNRLSPDGSIAVAQWSVSPDGRYLAYTTAAGGSDLQDIHLRVIATGRDLAEVVPRVKFSGISWTKDGRGFLYERFRGSAASANLRDANTYHQVWYHAVGGHADRMVFDRPHDGNDGVGGWVSDDGRWLFTSSASGTSNNRLWMADLGAPAHPNLRAPLRVVAPEEDAIHSPLGVVGDTLFLYTTWHAPKGRIVAMPLGDTARSQWRDVVPEGNDPIGEVLLVGTRIAVTYLVDVQSRLRLFDLAGRSTGEVALPEVGTAEGLSGRTDGTDFFFTFTSYLRPASVYRYDLASGTLSTFRPAHTPFDGSAYETRATFYRSKDGTRVPIFITARKGTALDGTHPTLLYGYGGFDVNIQPSYSPAVAAWLERGGVYAVANLRGGSEYGEAWHHAGMRGLKQNVFDDFIAAGQFLIHEGYTTPAHLAIQGASNGGLLVGAAMTERPDLFAVALPAVGVMDMLRYQKFTGGQFWADEYGSSDDSSAVEWLLKYSPLHNLRAGTCYPATLVTTADHDDRVVPSHSFKFTATLQTAQGCARPTLIRVETSGSHGYRPTDKVIAEIADEYAFALANLAVGAPANGAQTPRTQPAPVPPSQPFTLGADVSFLGSPPRPGRPMMTYRENGTPSDEVTILKGHGWDSYRLRVFVSPVRDAPDNSLENTIPLARRIKAAGGIFLLDIHYSDTWADPQHQDIPVAWRGLPFDSLAARVEAYSAATIRAFKDAGAMPDWVQVGNEITRGFLWPLGQLQIPGNTEYLPPAPYDSVVQWDHVTRLLKAGIRGVRAGAGDTPPRIAIHIDRGGDWATTEWFFDHLNAAHVEYDIIAQSFYPPWRHGLLEDLWRNMNECAQRYGKDFLVTETGYGRSNRPDNPDMLWPQTPEGRLQFMVDLVNTVQAAPRGVGVQYWAPEFDPWNADGSPGPAVFTLDHLRDLTGRPESHAPVTVHP